MWADETGINVVLTPLVPMIAPVPDAGWTCTCTLDHFFFLDLFRVSYPFFFIRGSSDWAGWACGSREDGPADGAWDTTSEPPRPGRMGIRGRLDNESAFTDFKP